MAFCTKCGRPLPQNGICACTAQQPVAPQQPYQQPVAPQQPYQQPYQQPVYQQPYQQPVYQQPYQQPVYQPKPANPNGFGASLMKLPTMILDYLKDSIGTTRRLNQQNNLNIGFAFLLLTAAVTLLATLIPGLVLDNFRYFGSNFFIHWLVTVIFAPAIAYGIGIGLIYTLTAMNKIKADFGGVLSVVGITSTLPLGLMAVSMLLSLVDSQGRVLAFFAILIVLAWLLSLLLATLQTYDIKVNFLNLLVIVGFFFVAIILIRTMWVWYQGGDFDLYLYMTGY